MFFVHENENNTEMDNDIVDAVVSRDPDTPEGVENIANDVENLMQQQALESVSYFENGETALKNFCESAEVQALVEARKMSKKTFVRLGKNDDLTRRTHLACLLLAKEHNDSLFKALALNRVKERKIRNAIFTKYGSKAKIIALKSQKTHIKAMKKMPALPAIRLQ
jgi:hypothetical protein